MSSNVKIVVDGNSIYTNVYGQPKMGEVLATLPPIVGAGVTIVDCAISGQTWIDMNNAPTDVDSAFDGSKTCILVCAETTNSVGNQGRTGAQAYGDAQAYITARLAAHPGWKIVLCSGLPRDGAANFNNTNISAADALMRANWRSMGVKAFVDYRQAGSPFAQDGTDPAVFVAQQSLWAETSAWLHPSVAGKTIMAQYICAQIKKLPKR